MFKLEFSTDNEAFEDNPGEIIQVLIQVTNDVRSGYSEKGVRDTNGNIIGRWNLDNEEDRRLWAGVDPDMMEEY